MARTIESFATSSYPWDQWMNGAIWHVTPGEDIENAAAFKNTLYSRARRLGYSVEVHSLDDGSVQFQFSKKSRKGGSSKSK